MVIKAGIVIAVILFLLSAGYGTYVALRDDRSAFDKKQSEYEARIDALLGKNQALERDMNAAKLESARAYERSRINAGVALQWRSKYSAAVQERDALKRAQTGSEAVSELRKMGWAK